MLVRWSRSPLQRGQAMRPMVRRVSTASGPKRNVPYHRILAVDARGNVARGKFYIRIVTSLPDVSASVRSANRRLHFERLEQANGPNRQQKWPDWRRNLTG